MKKSKSDKNSSCDEITKKEKFTLNSAKQEIIHLSKMTQMLISINKSNMDKIEQVFQLTIDAHKSIVKMKQDNLVKLRFPNLWKKVNKPD